MSQLTPPAMTKINLKQQEHPHLFLNAAEVENIRALAEQEGTYQHKRFTQIRQNANQWLDRPMAVPDQGAEGSLIYVCDRDGAHLTYNPETPHEHACPQCGRIYSGGKYDQGWRAFTHQKIAYTARDLALIYAVSGEMRYAQEAARILLEYARRYAAYPVINMAKLGRELLDDARWALALAAAYDLTFNSDVLTGEQKLQVENDLFRAAGHFMAIGQGSQQADRVVVGCNFEAMRDSGVGVLGLLVSDEELVHYALNGPTGFNRLMADGILENGLWWEGSPLYHIGVINTSIHLVEAAWHSGIDLYANEKFRRMFRVPLQLAFPDGSLPAIGDGRFGDSLERLRGLAELYYARTGDEVVEPLLIPGEVTGLGGVPSGGRGADSGTSRPARRAGQRRYQEVAKSSQPFWTDSPFDVALSLTPSWSGVEPAPQESVNLAPSFAVLRANREDDPLCLVLNYGPYGSTHGHPDSLNIMLYANGRLQAPDLGSCDYRLPQWPQWYQQALSHNTVVVDERSHYMGGRLNLYQISPRAKIVDATPAPDDRCYEVPVQVPRMRRTLAMLDESFIVDIFRAQGGNVYDWAYHNFGAFQTDERLVAQDAPLGETNGYQYVTNVRRGLPASDPWQANWTDDGQGVQLTILGTDDKEIITGDGLGTGIAETMPMVIARSRKRQTIFKSVLEPFHGETSITAVRELAVERFPSLPPGSIMRGPEGVGLSVEKRNGTHDFLLAYSWGSLRFGDIVFNGQIAYLSCENGETSRMPDFLYVVNASRVERGSFSLRADKMTTLYLERVDQGGYVLEHQGAMEATLTMTGDDWPGGDVIRLDGEGRESDEVEVGVADGAISFSAAPNSRYRFSKGG